MSSIPKSKFNCPVCNEPLCTLPGAAGRVLLWCGNGPCTSIAANDGESGLTEEQAYDKLRAAVIDGATPVEHDEDNQ